jgi:hypothetical protein
MVMTTDGNVTTMRFGEYILKGRMSKNIFTFQIFSSRGHHGEGRFTFSGNNFSGAWKDNWAKAGIWEANASGDRGFRNLGPAMVFACRAMG